MDEKIDKGFDWTTMARVVERHGRDPVKTHTTNIGNSLSSQIAAAAQPTAKLNFLFTWNGDTQRVELDAGPNDSIPRSDERIVLKFLDAVQNKYFTIEGRADPLLSQRLFVAANANTTGNQVSHTIIWLKDILVLLEENDTATDASEYLFSQ
jgi:hypothetical protein